MRWLIAAGLGAISTGAAFAIDCPPGAYAWPGPRGIEFCKREDYGPAEPAVRSDTCPAGTLLVGDRWGGRVCRTQRTGSR